MAARRRRRQRQSRRGGRFFQEGVGSARLPRGGLGSLLRGLPARAELPRPPLLPPFRAPNSYPGLQPSVDCQTASFQSLCGCVCLALLTQQKKDGIWDSPPGGYLFLTCCNLLAGSLLSIHLWFLHITAKIHFHAHWLNVVLHHSALSRGFLSS